MLGELDVYFCFWNVFGILGFFILLVYVYVFSDLCSDSWFIILIKCFAYLIIAAEFGVIRFDIGFRLGLVAGIMVSGLWLLAFGLPCRFCVTWVCCFCLFVGFAGFGLVGILFCDWGSLACGWLIFWLVWLLGVLVDLLWFYLLNLHLFVALRFWVLVILKYAGFLCFYLYYSLALLGFIVLKLLLYWWAFGLWLLNMFVLVILVCDWNCVFVSLLICFVNLFVDVIVGCITVVGLVI